MSIFKKDSSSRIGKKVADFKAQLLRVEGQLHAQEEKIEAAVAAGNDPDKLFIEAGVIRGNIESRRTILERVEMEYNDAAAVEERAAKTAELDRFGKVVEKGIAGIEKSLEDFVLTAEGFLIKENKLNNELNQLFSIPGPAGINFAMLPHFDIGFITQGPTVRLPMNTPTRAIATAEAEAKSNLSSIRSVMRGRIDKARNALEIKAAPPVVEPTVPMAPKKQLQIIDGMPKDLYLQRKKEDRAKRKAKETERDASVRTAVAAMDERADVADRRHF